MFPAQSTPVGIDRITVIPGICNGKPTIRGLRITVETILIFLSAGDSPEEILAEYPLLEQADIDACRAFADRMASLKSNVGERGE